MSRAFGTLPGRYAVAALAMTAVTGLLVGAGLVLTGHPPTTTVRQAPIVTPTVAPVGWS